MTREAIQERINAIADMALKTHETVLDDVNGMQVKAYFSRDHKHLLYKVNDLVLAYGSLADHIAVNGRIIGRA